MLTVQAAVTRAAGAPFSLETLRLEEPRPTEVLVRVVAAGVCHTDIMARAGSWPVGMPVVLGHEGSGVVVSVGSQVDKVRPGDHVVMTFGSCGACRPCRHGSPAYCVDGFGLNLLGNREDGTSALSGGVGSHFFGQSSFATHSVAPARNVVKVPADAPLDLLGPLGCGVQTGAGAVLLALRVGAGSSLAVFGAGAVGLAAVLAGAVAGAHPIVAVDRIPSRLALARELGATHVVPASDDGRPHDGRVVEAVRDITHGGAEYSLEAVGAAESFRQAVDALGPRGVCGILGAGGVTAVPTFSWRHVQRNGITIRGISEGDSNPDDFIPLLVGLHQRGAFPFERMIEFYDLCDVETAVQRSQSGATVKPVLRMPGPQ